MSGYKKIFVKMPNWVGDAVMATGFLRALREIYPSAFIAIGIRRYLKKVVRGLNFFDEIVETESGPGAKSFRGRLDDALRLRGKKFDCAVLLPHSFGSTWPTLLAGIPERVGYARYGRGLFLTKKLSVPVDADGRYVPTPMPIHYNRLLALFGVRPDDYSTWPALVPLAAERRRVRAILAARAIDPARGIVVMNPGAAFGSAKCWPAKHFVGLCRLIRNAHPEVSIIVNYGPGQRTEARECARAAGARVFAMGLGLGYLKALAEIMTVMVTNDSGPRQYAVAFRKPVVVTLGSSNPLYSDANLDLTFKASATTACPERPCNRRVCRRGGHECMEELRPEAVFEKFAAAWAAAKKSLAD